MFLKLGTFQKKLQVRVGNDQVCHVVSSTLQDEDIDKRQEEALALYAFLDISRGLHMIHFSL